MLAMNLKPFAFCAFLCVAAFALAGCGGNSKSATTTATATAADTTTKTVTAAATVTDTATDTADTVTDTVATSPSPGATPCADGSVPGEARPGKPGEQGATPRPEPETPTGERPVRGAVKSVDAATLTFVLAAPARRGYGKHRTRRPACYQQHRHGVCARRQEHGGDLCRPVG